MKKINFVNALLCCLCFEAIGQTNATIYDPYIGVISISPCCPYSTNNPPFVPVSGTATFIIGAKPDPNDAMTLPNYAPISWGNTEGCTSQACKLVVTISTTVSKTIITGVPTSGSFVGKFDWVLSNSNTLVGTQKSDVDGGNINPGTEGNIIVPISHISPSTIDDPVNQTHPCNQPGNNCTLGFTKGFNGVVVNLQPPSQDLPFSNDYPPSLQTDDNNGAYGYARTALPIQYIDFSLVDKQERGIQVLWKTVGEKNTKNFEIERSYNSNEWQLVGIVPSAGISTGERNYELYDNTFANKSKIYYRIKQVDSDGKFEQTKIKSINLTVRSNNSLVGYPNPARDIYHLTFNSKNEEKMGIEILSITGQIVSKKSILSSKGENYHDLNLGNLSQGTYFIRLVGKDFNETLKVVRME